MVTFRQNGLDELCLTKTLENNSMRFEKIVFCLLVKHNTT